MRWQKGVEGETVVSRLGPLLLYLARTHRSTPSVLALPSDPEGG